MAKLNKPVGKVKTQKLSKEQRSQIAKDRWAKKRSAQEATLGVDTSIQEESPVVAIVPTPVPQPTEQPPAVPESIATGLSGTPENLTPFRPAPQLTPAPPKKQKRYTGPKEFSVALKAAESRLAKALTERAEAGAKMAFLQAEIPSLLGIINALRGSQNAVTTLSNMQPFDPYGGVPNPTAFQASIPQQFQDPMQAFQAAQVPPPVSRASGGAIQFGPEVMESLEGPDDDDPDKFITGPAAGGKGWI